MLVSILLSIVWGICSTVLILPWFWKSLIKRKTIVGDKDNRGISEEKGKMLDFILTQVFFFGITCIVSLIMYTTVGVTRTLFGAVVPITFVLFCQMITVSIGWNEKRTQKYYILAGIAILFIVISSIYAYTGYSLDIKGIENESVEEKEFPITVVIGDTEQVIPSNDNIRDLFDVARIDGPTYVNNKYVYVTTSPEGVIIIDEYNAKVVKFLKTNYNFLEMRSKYPYNIIREMGIIITDENVPYKKYAVIAKKEIIARPVLEKYVYQNMLTGEITENEPN